MEVETAPGVNSNGAPNSQQMATATSPQDSVVHLDDFLSTGRTGRRNAVPDILTDGSANVSTADLPLEMNKLSCSDTNCGASTSQGTSAGTSGSSSTAINNNACNKTQ